MMHPDPEHFEEPDDEELPLWANIACHVIAWIIGGVIGVIALIIGAVIGIGIALTTIQVVEWLR